MGGESTIAAETRTRKRMQACRSSADVAPMTEVGAAAEMATTEMPTVMAAMMPTAMMTTAVASAAMTSAAMAATFRNGIPGGRQQDRENNEANPEIEFRHGALMPQRTANQRLRLKNSGVMTKFHVSGKAAGGTARG
jgi:hypothetical protein